MSIENAIFLFQTFIFLKKAGKNPIKHHINASHLQEKYLNLQIPKIFFKKF